MPSLEIHVSDDHTGKEQKLSGFQESRTSANESLNRTNGPIRRDRVLKTEETALRGILTGIDSPLFDSSLVLENLTHLPDKIGQAIKLRTGFNGEIFTEGQIAEQLDISTGQVRAFMTIGFLAIAGRTERLENYLQRTGAMTRKLDETNCENPKASAIPDSNASLDAFIPTTPQVQKSQEITVYETAQASRITENLNREIDQAREPEEKPEDKTSRSTKKEEPLLTEAQKQVIIMILHGKKPETMPEGLPDSKRILHIFPLLSHGERQTLALLYGLGKEEKPKKRKTAAEEMGKSRMRIYELEESAFLRLAELKPIPEKPKNENYKKLEDAVVRVLRREEYSDLPPKLIPDEILERWQNLKDPTEKMIITLRFLVDDDQRLSQAKLAKDLKQNRTKLINKEHRTILKLAGIDFDQKTVVNGTIPQKIELLIGNMFSEKTSKLQPTMERKMLAVTTSSPEEIDDTGPQVEERQELEQAEELINAIPVHAKEEEFSALTSRFLGTSDPVKTVTTSEEEGGKITGPPQEELFDSPDLDIPEHATNSRIVYEPKAKKTKEIQTVAISSADVQRRTILFPMVFSGELGSENDIEAMNQVLVTLPKQSKTIIDMTLGLNQNRQTTLQRITEATGLTEDQVKSVQSDVMLALSRAIGLPRVNFLMQRLMISIRK